MALDLVEFRQACADQRVGLHDVLLAPHGPGVSELEIVEQVAHLAHALVEEPDVRFARRPIDTSVLLDDDIPSQLLASMVNASIGVRDPRPGKALLQSGSVMDDSCFDAEEAFATSVRWLLRKDEILSGNRIFVNAHGLPVLVTRPRPQSSGLAFALQNVKVGDAVAPPGALVSYEEADMIKGTSVGGVEVASTYDISAAAITRLSAFALSPAERRQAFGGQIDTVDSKDDQIILNTMSLGTIRSLMHIALGYPLPSRF